MTEENQTMTVEEVKTKIEKQLSTLREQTKNYSEQELTVLGQLHSMGLMLVVEEQARRKGMKEPIVEIMANIYVPDENAKTEPAIVN